MRRSEIPILILLMVAIFCLLSFTDYKTAMSTQYPATSAEPDPRVKVQFTEWKYCMEGNISAYRNDSKAVRRYVV
ncbi:unnamed protein product [Strongylus vulgaris]|uniref:Uncharacterized protein n=1 Tax=Strongylus vulgaris TaxID=40348 RepID=A0A3P7IHD4_STRVU|nr:unnamed protein product [Strongylus vulgaris]